MNAFPAAPLGNDLDLPHIRPSEIEQQPPIPQRLVEIHGWGRAAGAMSHLHGIESVADAVSALRSSAGRGVTPRGLGRSYGDAAQNSGGATLDLTHLDKILAVDVAAEPATVTVQAGVSIDTLMKALLPFGLWVPVLPGTRQVTIGGAIAADVHGKNHHTQGSFGNHVRSLDLLTPDGSVRTLTRPTGGSWEGLDDDGRLFWTTIGGMGLTGAIVAAVVELQRVETAYFTVDTDRCSDIDDLMARMSEGDEDYNYSVAWFDAVTRGKHMGRAVLTRGDKARLSQLEPKQRRDPLKFAAPSFGTIPEVFPNRMVNKLTAKAFSEFWYRKAPQHRVGELQNITQFFHPLDIVAEWNRLYGPNGFLQYQFAVPFDQPETFKRCFEMIVTSGHLSCLNVLKRFGPGNLSPLSFPMPGWTLTVDLPIEPGLDRLCDALDEEVVGAGGRVYLAKDSRLTAQRFRQMYPRLDDFLSVRNAVDPQHLFSSDLARRLEI
ncbi:decaprenylphospho-beta-D-ribofuranose 2-oxidase [Microlunatus sagamiharensis]|uniref:Decaprenylphospho-beta-D-ribofuranose 2-oxidase n=1 Tax=Microlunatus sagamiharensis TaxID=546874 RepID=A0A1H2LIZ5_9ACTN|nr:FAD-binding oxidoreductase [Microlunatus sagamiharensis]SDU80987.1 decaprenylphospho-beta-D-ribofuranose 2-oxidase [Microlunatus sagamiharensis]